MAIHKLYPWRTADHAEAGKRLAQAATSIASMNGTLGQRLQALGREKKAESSGVSLLTMHASKGLEFDHVWIIGVEEGVIPSVRDGSDLEEERRLLYVAITRGKADLTLSYTLDRGPSKFLREARLIGADLLAGAA
jgi:Superfamily I DNA and RNA helicases